MKKNSLKKNYIFNLLYQVLVTLVPLVTTPYISRVLGAENIGIYSYTLSISAYFILIGALGTGLYAQRQIAFYQNDKQEYTKIFWEILILRCIGLAIAIIVFSALFAFSNNDYSLYYKILLLEILGAVLDISWLFQGLERFDITVIRNAIIKVISVILIFLFVKTSSDLKIYFYIYVFSIISGNLSLWLSVPRYLRLQKKCKLYPLVHFIPALMLFIPQAAIQVYTILDRTMLGYLIVDKSEVGYYDQAQKLIKTLIAIVTSLGTVMLPRIASKFSEGNNEDVIEYIYKAFRIVCMISVPICLGLICVSKSFVPIFYGNGYDNVAILLNIMAPVIFVIGFSNIIGVQYLLPTKKEKFYTISVICGASVNFVANYLLIPKFSAFGASLGTLIAETTVTGIQLIFVRKEISLRIIILNIWHYIFAGAIMFLLCKCVCILVRSGIICMIVQIIIGGLSYFAGLFIIRDKTFLSIFPQK